MIAVGIDPGTSCGWAILDAHGARLASGTWDLAARRHEGGGMRYVRLRRYLGELLDGQPGVILGYEEVRRHRGVDAAHVYGGIIATIASVCEERSVPYRGVPVASAKRCATGKGNADKPAMVAAADARWSCEVGTDDEADALWIAETLRLEVA